MSTLTIPKSPPDVRWPRAGQYVQVVLDGRKTARLSCPDCGRLALLEDHRIIEDSGQVVPSVVCSNCSFHKNIQLANWDSR